MKLRLLTWNIHKCIGGVDRRYDPQRVADAIAHYQPDVVLLQEVDAGVKRSNGDHQVDLLGDLCGFHHRTWFPNVDIRGGGAYGNAILSRYPIVETRNVDLTIKWKKRRSVLHAVCRVRHGEIDRSVHVFNMHLGLAGFERRIQLQKFLASHPFSHLHHDTPVIVGGDLNDVYGGLGELLAPSGFRGITKRPLTFPAWGPVRALDAICVRGAVDFMKLTRCDSELVRRASDHRPLVAEVRLHAHQTHHAHEHPPPAPRP